MWVIKNRIAKSLGDTNTIIVVLDVGVFDYERVCYIILEYIDNFCSIEKITSSCIVLYMR